MVDQQQINYDRIEKAILYIQENFKEQPSLDKVAAFVHLSPYHFQRLFKEWAGVSPKKFMQYVSVEYAKALLRNEQTSLLHTALQTGLSGTGRLHDLFISIEGMTPGDFKNGGVNLRINYRFEESPFGKIILASTPKGVCHIMFVDDESKALQDLKSRFPKAELIRQTDHFQQQALMIFQHDWQQIENIKLHLQGTPFQLKVWESLLKSRQVN